MDERKPLDSARGNHMRTALIIAAVAALLPSVASAAATGLVKGSWDTVYWVGTDQKRHVFPDIKTYLTWFPDLSGVQVFSDDAFASFPLGSNVMARPGVRLLKIQSDPKVYAVGRNGTLRWIKTEAVAASLYGAAWATKVDDLSDAFFADYSHGEDIASAADFSPAAETATYAQAVDSLWLVTTPPVAVPVATSTPPAATSTSEETPTPSFGITVPTGAPSGLVSPSPEQTVGAFVITNGPGAFTMVLKGLTLTLSSTISNTAPRLVRVYRDTVNAGTLVASGSPCLSPVTVCSFAPMTFDDASFVDTDISPNMSRTFFVTADTSDATTGNTFTASIPHNGVLWSDGITPAITIFDGLPLAGNTLRY